MTCEIIQLSTSARLARTVSEKTTAAEVTAFVDRGLTPRQMRRLGKPELPPPTTETSETELSRKRPPAIKIPAGTRGGSDGVADWLGGLTKAPA
jgi:hypothetical protein